MAALVVTSKIKQMAKAVGLRVSAEFIEELSKHVTKVVIASAKKAREVEMKTIKDRHLTITSEMTTGGTANE